MGESEEVTWKAMSNFVDLRVYRRIDEYEEKVGSPRHEATTKKLEAQTAAFHEFKQLVTNRLSYLAGGGFVVVIVLNHFWK